MAQWAFVEIRHLGWSGRAQEAGDLADVFHNVSMDMWGWGGWEAHVFREELVRYQAKYPDRLGYDYVTAFDRVLKGEPLI